MIHYNSHKQHLKPKHGFFIIPKSNAEKYPYPFTFIFNDKRNSKQRGAPDFYTPGLSGILFMLINSAHWLTFEVHLDTKIYNYDDIINMSTGNKEEWYLI